MFLHSEVFEIIYTTKSYFILMEGLEQDNNQGMDLHGIHFFIHLYEIGSKYLRELGIKSWKLFFPSHLDDDTTK